MSARFNWPSARIVCLCSSDTILANLHWSLITVRRRWIRLMKIVWTASRILRCRLRCGSQTGEQYINLVTVNDWHSPIQTSGLFRRKRRKRTFIKRAHPLIRDSNRYVHNRLGKILWIVVRMAYLPTISTTQYCPEWELNSSRYSWPKLSSGKNKRLVIYFCVTFLQCFH